MGWVLLPFLTVVNDGNPLLQKGANLTYLVTSIQCNRVYFHLLLQVAEAFYEVCREVNTARRKNKTSLLDRVLGNKVCFDEVIGHPGRKKL